MDPEARDRVALEHGAEEDGHAVGEDDSSGHRDASSKSALNGEDAPVEEKDPNLDDSHSKRPEHHEDVDILKWLVGKCDREWRRYDLKASVLRSL